MTKISPTPPSNIKWPELMFYAEANNEPFENITVVTAQTRYVDAANNIACDLLNAGSISEDISDSGERSLDKAVVRIINDQKHSVYETVVVDKDGIRVCINVAALDEAAMAEALNRVEFALSELHGQHGVIFFGEELTFTTADIPWLFD